MSHSDYKVTLRLPVALKEYIGELCEEYGLSINEAVKHCIIEHKRCTNLALNGITSGITSDTIQPRSQNESGITGDTMIKKSGITGDTITTNLTVTGEVEKKGSGITSDTNSDTTGDTIPSSQGAPYILYILNNNKYKLIISDPTLKEAWDDWCNYCKSKRKTIKDSQLKQAFRDFETIYAVEGLDGIIDRLNRAISSGYVGWYFGKKTLEAKPVTVTNGNFTEDDF
jgi:hypothetical protein